ncbi:MULTISPECIES: hypothetical protein [unclassified Corynebacterium]|uniref:hypothetical protein n=1 Tax=unclassified Corynebacterium TaxID=2624378 RepID=UPI0029C9E471|nr:MULTISPECIES: hypothetical protein [unclassified Corynebacterium]WPF66318.1 hypothetical protein OLX12_00885 [Corynebacterium sp. 22KM0430]WPF68808.1 hypothetical protein OLW90_00885 [Corynebacterium sp. 21KM1197]
MFDGLRRLGRIDSLVRQAARDIAAVHRRPVNLRRYQVTSAESVLRGARTTMLIDAFPPASSAPEALEVGGYALLAPSHIEATARTWARAPLQVIARLDVLFGGTGVPREGAAVRLREVGELVVAGGDDALLPQVMHAEIAAREVFGPRSGAVARVAARVAAVSSGFDPRGLAVPEPYLYRHRHEYAAALEGYGASVEGVSVLLELLLRAWIDGAREAESIAALL